MERKLIAFDLDGTLLNQKKLPLVSTREAIIKLKNAGHIVSIATGRNRFLSQKIIQDLGFDYAVLCNGSVSIANKKILYEKKLDQKELNALCSDLHDQTIDFAVVGLDATHRLSSFNEEIMSKAMNSFGAPLPIMNNELLVKNSVYQGLAYYNEKQAIDTKKYQTFDFIRWHDNCVDVIPKGGSKAVTLLAMAKSLGINNEHVLAFGDGLNDREMLREVGIGIAMGNASEEVKKYADMVTDTNEKDGISKALKQLGLID